MEDVLDVYQTAYDDDTVLICLHKTSQQQTRANRIPLLMRLDQPACYDDKHECHGTANLLMLYASGKSWRHVKVTNRRTQQDFVHFPWDLADVHCPDKTIVLVMDNLNIQKLSTLYITFDPKDAVRLACRFSVHHTPKHGSCLNNN